MKRLLAIVVMLTVFAFPSSSQERGVFCRTEINSSRITGNLTYYSFNGYARVLICKYNGRRLKSRTPVSLCETANPTYMIHKAKINRRGWLVCRYAF